MSRLCAAVAFLGCILAANYATSRYGIVLGVTAGTYFAGLTFVLRDTVQDGGTRKRGLVALIVAGAILSYVVSDTRLAIASGVAFLISELADYAVYSPMRAGGYVRAAVASNVVGACLDSLLFLTVAGFPVSVGAVGAQIAAKLSMTALALGVRLAVSREPVRI